MDGARDLSPPEPGGVTGPAEFVECLRELRRWAGQPSLRRLQQAAVGESAHGVPLPPSTVSVVLAGHRLPRLAFVEAFVAACLSVRGHSVAEIRAVLPRWARAWRTLARAESPGPAVSAPPARPLADVDPTVADTAVEFVARLRLLRVWAGDPSLSVLRRRTGVPRSTLYDALATARTRLPPLDLVRKIVSACDRPPAEVARWEAAWRALQSRVSGAKAAEASVRGVPVPRQLPADVRGFVGRADELAWLDRREDGLVVVSGSAGVGKTALVVHWAHRAAARYPDGQLHLDLRGFAAGPPVTPAQALGALLRGLGVPTDQVPVDAEARANLYRSVVADRSVLVVLDNAVDVAQVRALLPGTPSCKTVVTTRHALSGLIAREGAQRLELGRLRPADARAVLAAILGEDRVAGEEEAAAELARLCAYLPLALRVAAANLADRQHAALAGYVAELASGDLLAALAVNGDGDAAVGAALDVSYEALPDGARRLFRRLGLFPGPDFGVQVAAALDRGPPGAAAAHLTELAAAHLIEAVGPGRYALHDLLRLCAARRAAAEETDPTGVVDRFAEWYHGTAVNAVEVVRSGRLRLPDRPQRHDVDPLTFDTGEAALAWLDAERAGLLALARSARDGIAWYLPDALGGYLMLRGGQLDWFDIAASGLAAARAAGDRPGQMAMYSSFGLAWWSRGDVRGIEYFERARRLAQALGDRRWETTMGLSIGMLHREAGSLGPAAEHMSRALAGYVALNDSQMVARTRKSLGTLYRAAGRLDEAAASLRESAAWYLAAGDHLRYADSLGSLGMVHRDRGELGEATSCLQTALAAYREVDNGPAEACMLEALATVQLAGGDPILAATTATTAAALAHRCGHRRFEGLALVTLATAEHRLGAGAAEEHARRALRLARNGPYRPVEVQALTVLADLAACRGERARALDLAALATEQARAGGYPLLEAAALVVLGRARHANGDRAAAEESERAARRIFAAAGVPDGVRACPGLTGVR